jgi:glycerol-3-phosphate dehydrogenase
VSELEGASFDLLVVGGGINGTGIARDAAGRGLTVLLVEQDDLAAHTSSASTKLIHGGLRYLEEFHFALVRKALIEREVLLRSAPHIMRPLHFIMPHAPHLRPSWMIRAGLFLYDHLARRERLAASGGVDLRTHIAGAALKSGYTRGFVYSDGQADDARLVVLNALDARERGAAILTRTRCERLTEHHGGWRATLAGADGRIEVAARVAVNASGPWVDRFVRGATPVRTVHRVRLVKGSHIVVPRLFDHRFAYIFQNEDRRIVFAIPYEHEFTLLGTTDVDYHGDPAAVRIDEEELRYLCELANRYFTRQTGPRDVRWSYSGVRPLLADESRDPMSVTRDYALELRRRPAPLLSVFGGKITTYRKLAERVMAKLADKFPGRAPWTHAEALPGGEMNGLTFRGLLLDFRRRHPRLPKLWLARVLRRHGSLAEEIIGDAKIERDLGRNFGGGLVQRELDYLVKNEWAREAEDVLWRRTKCGLHMSSAEKSEVRDYLAKH